MTSIVNNILRNQNFILRKFKRDIFSTPFYLLCCNRWDW